MTSGTSAGPVADAVIMIGASRAFAACTTRPGTSPPEKKYYCPRVGLDRRGGKVEVTRLG